MIKILNLTALEQISVLGLVFGFLGGLVRALIGIGKHLEKNKNRFCLTYFLYTLAISTIIGAVVGSLILNDLRFALAAGYAGSDFLEGLYKVSSKRIK